MGRILVAFLVCSHVSACAADFYGRGLAYSEKGRYDVAVHYLIGAHRGDPENPEIKARMQAEMERAKALWTATYERLDKAGESKRALGAAKRLEILSHLGTEMGLPGFDPEQPAAAVDVLEGRVSEDAIAAVDDAADSGLNERARLSLLREARALNPHDEEINNRYLRVKGGLTRYVRLVPKCEPALRDHCLEVGHSILEAVTKATRELIVLVPEGAAKHNTDLVVRMGVDANDTGWRVKQRGKAEHGVKQYDATKKVILNDKGKPALKAVSASYAVHERATMAKVAVSLELFALEGGRSQFWSKSTGGKLSDKASYYDWSGDHRALKSVKTVWVMSHGTDRTPPAEPMGMARQIWTKSADTLTKAMIETLEATP